MSPRVTFQPIDRAVAEPRRGGIKQVTVMRQGEQRRADVGVAVSSTTAADLIAATEEA